MTPDPGRVRAARELLDELLRAPDWPTGRADLADLARAAAALASKRKSQERRDARSRDRELRAAPDSPALPARGAKCYACGEPFARPHPAYRALCGRCGDGHALRRAEAANLSGRVALVTGARLRSGFEAALKLLRAGAEVVATTRFPRDAARRYSDQSDAADWSGRLRVVPLDLRPLRGVERFADHLCGALPRLDILVVNAAQTVRRPPAYYRTLAAAERAPSLRATLADCLDAGLRLLPTPSAITPAELALVPLMAGDDDLEPFPPGALDALGDPLDLRATNSWFLSHEQVETPELLEVHAVNCLAPFLLLRGLRPLFRAGPPADRFAVMVSAAEGSFAANQTGRHPHTNMAKAALNMMVRTSAAECLADRLHLTAVDPGWFSPQTTADRAARAAEAGHRVPIDAVDAAARILAPVWDGVNRGVLHSGVLFKDYEVHPW